MRERLKGQFMGCPYHDDDYEACIQYSGQAPCDPPDGWQMVLVEPTREMLEATGDKSAEAYRSMLGAWTLMLRGAPKPGDRDAEAEDA